VPTRSSAEQRQRLPYLIHPHLVSCQTITTLIVCNVPLVVKVGMAFFLQRFASNSSFLTSPVPIPFFLQTLQPSKQRSFCPGQQPARAGFSTGELLYLFN
jgi:hypothetical protein